MKTRSLDITPYWQASQESDLPEVDFKILVDQIIQDLDLESVQVDLEQWLEPHLEQLRQQINERHELSLTLRQLRRQGNQICQSDVASVEHHLSPPFDKRSLTQMPSEINYQPVIISLEQKNWGLIALIAVGVANLIFQLVRWITGRSARLDAEKSLEKTQDLIKDLEKRYAEQGGVVAVAQLQEGEKGASQRATPEWNAYDEECLLMPGTFVTGLFGLRNYVFNEYMEVLLKMHETFKATLNEIKNSVMVSDYRSDFEHKTAEHFKRFHQQIEQELKISIGIGNLRDHNKMGELVGVITQERQKLKNQPANAPFDVATITQLYEKGHRGVVHHIHNANIKDDRDFQNKLKKIKKISDDLKSTQVKNIEVKKDPNQPELHDQTVSMVESMLRDIQDGATMVIRYAGLLTDCIERQVVLDQQYSAALKKVKP